MREIKFRARNKDNTKWLYFSIEFLALVANTGTTLDTVDLTTKQQYTGLKDKNGKEIYEGDIVFNKNLEDLLLVEYTKYSDIIIGLISGFYLKNNRNKILEHHLSLQDCEIMGNIYENPELWEDGQCTS